MQDKGEYNKHFQTHNKPFLYQCKNPGCGKKFIHPSSFSMHKKSCQHEPQSPTEQNPQLGHTLPDTRSHIIADQYSVDQQDHSSDEHPSENFINLDKPDDSIFDDLNIPDNVVVNIEDINLENFDNDNLSGNIVDDISRF
ncbi:hypothetical protein LOAG_12009 [Loa loa]|uniref:C2H2-type domain-containing protein n=1 Tax=Loa loa TaxID=7209 RepID=A0A1S0TNJ3_LOALO|nr:hypothetical protein LOAG_12009 [Loa loa]EFO16498.1 hypothetical protein LOAG_12009 [Loa loa]